MVVHTQIERGRKECAREEGEEVEGEDKWDIIVGKPRTTEVYSVECRERRCHMHHQHCTKILSTGPKRELQCEAGGECLRDSSGC